MSRVAPLERSLWTTNHELMVDWDPEVNVDRGLDPKCVFPGSDVVAAWICSKCGYRWDAPVKRRARQGRGCGACAGQIVTPTNCLATVDPGRAAAWCSEKNGNRTPRDVTAGSGASVWWSCLAGLGHLPYEMPVDRRKVSGCPDCGKLVTGGRPIMQTLAFACEEAGLSQLLKRAWVKELNEAEGVRPDEVGFQSHVVVHFRCERCPVTFKRSVANWFGKPSYLCTQCASLSIWDGRRKVSIAELASEEPESRIMAVQWDEAANAAAGFQVTTTSPTFENRVQWRCLGCEHSWKISPKNRWAGLRQKLQRIQEQSEILEPDGEFACPRCCATPGASSAELALALELKIFFPEAYSGFLSDEPPVDLGDPGVFRPDIVFPSCRLFVEYDGHRFHKDHVERDLLRTRQVQTITGFRVLRVRERDNKGRPQPEIDCWHINAPIDPSFVELTAAVLHALAEVGLHPAAPSAPDVGAYQTDGVWLTQNEAIEARRLLGQGEHTPTGRVKKLGQQGLIAEYDKSGHRWTQVAEALGFETVSGLSSAVQRFYGLNPIDLAQQHGRPAHQGSLHRGRLEQGQFDHLLGVESDAAIARQACVTKQAVSGYRKTRQVGTSPPRRSCLEDYLPLLGQRPDAEIAQLADCSVSNVKQYRRSKGIRRRGGPASGADAWLAYRAPKLVAGRSEHGLRLHDVEQVL